VLAFKLLTFVWMSVNHKHVRLRNIKTRLKKTVRPRQQNKLRGTEKLTGLNNVKKKEFALYF
jgi:hypothetical protein